MKLLDRKVYARCLGSPQLIWVPHCSSARRGWIDTPFAARFRCRRARPGSRRHTAYVSAGGGWISWIVRCTDGLRAEFRYGGSGQFEFSYTVSVIFATGGTLSSISC